MSFPLELGEAFAVFAVVAVGSSVQASVGFGLGLIAAPILLLVDSRLVPGPLMASGIVLTVFVAYRERAAIDLVGLRFAFGGRVLGTVLAAAVLASISQRVFDFLFASFVLAAVAVALSGWSVAPNRGRTAVAGMVSGFMGTVSSIGGPPMALLYLAQDHALKSRSTPGLLQRLPALEECDRVGLQALIVGFVMLTLGIGTGIAMNTGLHSEFLSGGAKQIFPLLAWAVFLVVLLARTWLGYRGRKSALLTIAGFLLGLASVAGMAL